MRVRYPGQPPPPVAAALATAGLAGLWPSRVSGGCHHSRRAGSGHLRACLLVGLAILFLARFLPDEGGVASGASIPPTSTKTPAGSIPPTHTPTPTAIPVGTPLALLFGHVGLQRSGAPTPSGRYVTDVAVRIYAPNQAVPLRERTPVAEAVARTTDSGAFYAGLLGLSPAPYDVNVKPAHALSVEKAQLLMPRPPDAPGAAPGWPLVFGEALEGDANDDDAVTILDFSLLATAFGKRSGDPGFDRRPDFNQDGAITILDFSLLATSFNRQGPVIGP